MCLFRDIAYEEFDRYVKKKRPCKRAALSIWAMLGGTKGGSFTGTFGSKIKCISGFLFLGSRGH
jgi:hypothetical protein